MTVQSGAGKKTRGVAQGTERYMERAMRKVQHKGRKRAKDMMLILGLDETIDQLDTENSVCL